MSLSVVILAAGRGTRMCSSVPKGLHPIAGKPILDRIVTTARALHPQEIVVVCGKQSEPLKAAFVDSMDVAWAEQTEPLGTGHAALQALPCLSPTAERILIAYGDIPLITVETLQRLLAETPDKALGLITQQVPDPSGLGRIVRDHKGHVIGIVEEKEATVAERQITEVNTGFFVVPKRLFAKWANALTLRSQEYYLSEVLEKAVSEGVPVHTVFPEHFWEVQGVNDRAQLVALERLFQHAQAIHWMRQGVTIQDPARLDIRGDVHMGQDVTLDINVLLEGRVTLGQHVVVGPNVCIKNATIGDGTHILANSVIEEATIGERCVVGPFARIRPGTCLAEGVRVGNFVELKKTTIAAGSKVNHLSYLGDAQLGKEVNIGAGTITCNFDGVHKHVTIIADGAFVGSDTQLIAPVRVGENATIGAGTTVVRDVLANTVVHNKIQHRVVDKADKAKVRIKEEEDNASS